MGPARSSGRVSRQKSAVELDLMWRVKAALDPDDLFNPGRGSHCATVPEAEAEETL
tara:strand:- start:44 stop:211 length:168 start_codon:yes stop_codon:yes gene_type:complete